MQKASGSTSSAGYSALVRLLVRHGRSDLVSGAGLDDYLVDEAAPLGDPDKAELFAQDLEAMGPTYVKLGQLLSTRTDLLPPAYTEALTRLQDDVAPIPFEEVQEAVETELGAGLRHLFASFDEQPLAAASLGQVHRATLPSGREVVVKVQRPGAREIVRNDMQVLGRLAALADSRTETGRRTGFAELLQHFQRAVSDELDYRREARNLLRMRELTAGYDLLLVPEPVADYSTSRVLTMDFVDGAKVTDVGPLGMIDHDTGPIAEQLFQAYLTMILDHGFLHADPHPGNLVLTDDGRLGLIDLGMVASVPQRLQDKLVKLLVAIGEGDGEEAAIVLAEMGRPLDGYDAARFRDDVSHLVSSAVAAGNDLQAGTVVMELQRISGAHGLRPPAEMSMVGKALLNLDRSTSHLDPDFSAADAIGDNLSRVMAHGLKTSPGGMLRAALEAKEFTTQLPRRANRILDTLAEGELHLRVDAIDEERLLTVLQRVANRLVLGIIVAATLLGAALMMRIPTEERTWGYPTVALFFFLLAAVGGVVLSLWILVSDRRTARKARSSDQT
jgi:ubiquinone biosynthesis protein